MKERIDHETGEVFQGPPPADGMPSGAGELISQGNQLLQIRTKNQLMVAIQRPRDLVIFESKLNAMAAAAGEDFFYSIKYRDGTLIEGPGVGLARSAAQLWGNCAIETRIEEELPDAFLVRSDWIDFETNYTRSETKRVGKLKPRKGGGYVRAKDKELDVVYQQGASKVERDTILRSLPRHIVERAFELAKAAALQEKAPAAQQIARIIRRFGEFHVSNAMIEKYLGCTFTEKGMTEAEKNPKETCAHLRGLMTAIRGGDTTVEEVFGAKDAQPSPSPASQTAGAIRPEDVESPKPTAPPQPESATSAGNLW